MGCSRSQPVGHGPGSKVGPSERQVPAREPASVAATVLTGEEASPLLVEESQDSDGPAGEPAHDPLLHGCGSGSLSADEKAPKAAELVHFYSLDVARVPDELYKPSVPWEDMQPLLRTAGAEGFPPGSLTGVAPMPLCQHLERVVTIPVYLLMNVAPPVLPMLLWLACGWRAAVTYVICLLGVHAFLFIVNPMGSLRDGQYIKTERNTQSYLSVKWVWPETLQPPNTPGPKIFCAVPHGLAPIGITAYPMWSKMFGDELCRWTCAQIIFWIPVVSYCMKGVGYVRAKADNIKQLLAEGSSAGVLLDGVPGMFQTDPAVERAFLQKKGIVKIALTTGTPLVPVYCFGQSMCWRILVDPCGILERVSVALDVAMTPFFGRPFGIMPFGPPFRTPTLIALGDPVIVPKVEAPPQEQIDEYHTKLVNGFRDVFERHKAAYGWPDKKLKVV